MILYDYACSIIIINNIISPNSNFTLIHLNINPKCVLIKFHPWAAEEDTFFLGAMSTTQQLKRSEEEEALLRDIREEKERIWIDIQVPKLASSIFFFCEVFVVCWEGEIRLAFSTVL